MTTFAGELGLVRTVDRDGIVVHRSRPRNKERPLVLVTAGMGARRVALAVEAAFSSGSLAALISTGFAGACDPLVAAGSVVCAAAVVDTQTGERFGTDSRLTPAAAGVLATAPAIAGPREKLRLFQSYGATAVDMEASVVARLASARATPFAAIKAISDEASDDLTPLGRYAGSRGQFRTAAFALHTALRPGQWNAAARLGRNSKTAVAALTGALQQVAARESAVP